MSFSALGLVERASSVASGTMSVGPANMELASPQIVKEGLLHKRGEYIKTWRPRYFYLFDNGMLLGFSKRPENDLNDPLNNFTVKGCRILPIEKPRPNSFIIRGLSWTTVVERIFYADTALERQDWLDNIQAVKERLAMNSAMDDEDMADTQALEELEMPPSNDVPPLHMRRRITKDSFELLKVLGEGTFGKVILGRGKWGDKKLYAIKTLKKDVIIKREEVAHTLTENKVLQKIDHPFLIHSRCSFETDDRLFFVLEFVNGGELFFHLSREKFFTEDRARFYAAEICLALGYLHDREIIYRDLKLENLLLDSEGHIKIADFGLCKEQISYGATTRTFCGTPQYLAPEVLEDSGYGRSVDWWGYGVCLYEMMIGRLPFSDNDQDFLYEKIVKEDVRFPPNMSIEAKRVLRGLLLKDPHQRLGGGPADAKEVMAHPFFVGINWVKLEAKEIAPPFKPQVTSDTDTKYFDDEFTSKPVQLTPPVISEEMEECIIFEQFPYQDVASTMGSSLASSSNSLDVMNHY